MRICSREDIREKGLPMASRLGILADIHGHHAHLDRVLDELAGCDGIVNLGDTVGNPGDTGKVIERLQAAGVISILGNHDLEAIQGATVAPSALVAKWMENDPPVPSLHDRLSDEATGYFQNRPFGLRARNGNLRFGFFHSIYGCRNGRIFFDYVHGGNAAKMQRLSQSNITFVGHRHIPSVFIGAADKRFRAVRIRESLAFRIAPSTPCIVNVGSVGASRDPRMQYSYAVLDTQRMTVDLIVRNIRRR